MTAMTNLSAEDLARMDQAHALRPWTHFESVEAEPPLVISRGEGCYLWDANGNRYLDAVGGLWCTNIGLGRKEMAQAIAEQAERLAFSNTFVDVTNDPAAMLSAKLAEIAPAGMGHVHFTTCGSTAIDSAYRLAQYAQAAMGRPEKTHMIARQRSYHGSTYIAMSLGLRDGDRVPEFEYRSDTIHHVSAPFIRRPADEAAETAKLVAEFEAKIAEVGAEKIAAFFAEPIQASGGVVVPPEGYLRAMWETCRKHDILFVADEVVTAFGRLGHWFASDGHFGITPDIICCAKGLSSGYLPIGAVIFSDEIWAAMAGSDRWYTSGFTYSGHPVACAAALKNIEIIEREDLLGHARAVSGYFQSRLQDLGDLPIVGETRGVGLFACIENVADPVTMRPLPEELNIGKRISDASEARGLMVRPLGHQNVMSPPLIITRDQIDIIADTLRMAITEVADGLVREGVKLG